MTKQVDQVDLFSPAPTYPAAPGFKRRGTSEDAAKAASKSARHLRLAVLGLLQGHVSGFTPDEAAAILRENILSIRPRFSELVKAGKIEDSGRRRINASGRAAIVWQIKASS